MLLKGEYREWAGSDQGYVTKPCFILQLDTMQHKATVADSSGQLRVVDYSALKLARSHIPLFDDEKETQ